MNHRDYKQFAAGECYHIYNRGNAKMDIFRDAQDYQNFLKRLEMVLGLAEPVEASGRSQRKALVRLEPLPKGSFSVVSYCLMPNHFHILIKQNGDISISKLMAKLTTSYAMYFNKKYNRVGGIFQDKFKAVPVDTDQYLQWLSVYIHQNPPVAGLIEKPEDWPWSSYSSCISNKEDIICDTSIILENYKNSDEYKAFVESSFDIIKQYKDVDDLLMD